MGKVVKFHGGGGRWKYLVWIQACALRKNLPTRLDYMSPALYCHINGKRGGGGFNNVTAECLTISILVPKEYQTW